VVSCSLGDARAARCATSRAVAHQVSVLHCVSWEYRDNKANARCVRSTFRVSGLLPTPTIKDSALPGCVPVLVDAHRADVLEPSSGFYSSEVGVVWSVEEGGVWALGRVTPTMLTGPAPSPRTRRGEATSGATSPRNRGSCRVRFCPNPNRALRLRTPLAAEIGYGVASLLAAQRVYRQSHWASDVVVGAALSTVVSRKIVGLLSR
jgi:hypothetical protein